MKRKHLLLYLVACAILFSSTACSNDDLMEETDLVLETQVKHPHRIIANLSPKDYNVNIDMVNGYLRLTQRINELRSITPLTIDQDTLAWAVQYQKGWQVLSGDSRMAPVMISCEEGDFELKEQSPNTNAVNGLLHYIRDIHYGADTLKNRVWKFLETSDLKPRILRSPRRIGGEIATRGMWVAIDSTYENSTIITVPHIVQTKWGIGKVNSTWNEYNSSNPQYKCPWNGYIKTYQSCHFLVGCPAVAIGQIIYHFRKTNPRQLTAPMNGNITGDMTDPSLSEYSVSAWQLMANDSSSSNLKYTALFLSDLSNRMGMSYVFADGSGGVDDPQDAADQLNAFLLNYDSRSSYDYNIINNNLSNGKIICVFASSSALHGHVLLIDSKRERNEYYKVHYLWDNDYEVSWEEYNRLDPWRFEMPDDYDPIENNEVYHEQIISGSKSIDFAMNWGEDGNCDNIYFAASYRIYPFTDEYGYYPGAFFTFDPYWAVQNTTYNDIDKMYYNIREL